MKIVRGGNVDSGAGTAGFKAHRSKLKHDAAAKTWKARGRNRLWIKAALNAFHEAGGFVPPDILKNGPKRNWWD